MDKFVQIDREFMDLAPKLGASAFMVYSFLKMYMNQKTRQCFPKQQLLSEKTGYNTRQIMRAIKILELNGLIHVTRAKKKANNYYLRNKTFWGQDIYSLGRGIVMKCPECDIPVVKDKPTRNFICPKCLTDVGGYCRDVLMHHFPDITDKDIFKTGSGGQEMTWDRRMMEGEQGYTPEDAEDAPASVPLIYVDFKTGERRIVGHERHLPYVFAVERADGPHQETFTDEKPFYCPNCKLVLTGLTHMEVDCPWCQEKVTYKEMNRA